LYPHVASVDREFQLAFSAHLTNSQVGANGHEHSQRRPMKHPKFVLDVVRAMFQWASDPDRGDLLPEGFRNPFVGRKHSTRQVATDPLGEPDITVPMAVSLLGSCDLFQLSVFVPLILFGLRPSELGWIFREDNNGAWLRMRCRADLDYFTKGRRDKSFPIPNCLRTLWERTAVEPSGLCCVSRSAIDNRNPRRLIEWSSTQLFRLNN